MTDMDIRDTSVIQTYQWRLNSKSYVPATTFGRATLDADGVTNVSYCIPVQRPRRRRPVIKGFWAYSKQYGVL
jgi:hypothetical protein